MPPFPIGGPLGGLSKMDLWAEITALLLPVLSHDRTNQELCRSGKGHDKAASGCEIAHRCQTLIWSAPAGTAINSINRDLDQLQKDVTALPLRARKQLL
jgi:hypothetical protein